jgi:hypothetical protein
MLFFRTGESLPEFGAAETNVTVQREGTAFLDCPVKTAGDRPVSYPLVGTVHILWYSGYPLVQCLSSGTVAILWYSAYPLVQWPSITRHFAIHW